MCLVSAQCVAELGVCGLQFALGTAERIAEFAVGSNDGDVSLPAAIASIHPPAVQLTNHLTNFSVRFAPV